MAKSSKELRAGCRLQPVDNTWQLGSTLHAAHERDAAAHTHVAACRSQPLAVSDPGHGASWTLHCRAAKVLEQIALTWDAGAVQAQSVRCGANRLDQVPPLLPPRVEPVCLQMSVNVVPAITNSGSLHSKATGQPLGSQWKRPT
jgi:hypothetical protein